MQIKLVNREPSEQDNKSGWSSIIFANHEDLYPTEEK